ncbi:hypothetical protein [Exiguobacterium sp. s102]|uniref:YobI family P-loop NTPase n=1 Tax=Exiguobacterium sp. s102 TaxID=2751212 RepID=UPI002037605E|nr:hypothetical protein [Exiguobacterium sp. s102]
MKSYIIKFISIVNNRLVKIQKSLDDVEKNSEKLFEDLTPSTDIDEDGKYAEAITWGLENKEVKNIALTGPYGSGKSSLLKTYEKRNQVKYYFLNISLATFQSKEGQNQESDLEKSILQQMIYRVKDRTIPYSRFKRIKHVKNLNIILFLILFVSSLLAGIFLFHPIYLKSVFYETPFQENITSGLPSRIVLTILLLIIMLMFPLIFLKNIYKFFRGNLNFNKVTIASTTLEKNNEETQSIFDKYLDEILYFFEATKYNVVVLEDLDRFDNLDIFERLRELNSLLNNSEQIKRKIVFIYAIKDEIFGIIDKESKTNEIGKNRTKFFDFIIPVIPIINSSNSIDKLTIKIDKLSYGHRLDQNFLSDITIYIDDMRILKNIFNEFIIYKEKLGRIDLDLNRLMAIVVYKNIYPFDFSQLQFNKGIVYEILKSKREIIHSTTLILDKEIEKLEEKIDGAEQETLVSIKELQVSYLDELGIYKYDGSNNYSITLDSMQFSCRTSYGIQSFFENLKNSKQVRYNLPRWGSGTVNSTIIASVFDSKKNYFEREEHVKILEELKIDSIKNELSKLRQQRDEISTKSLKELIAINDQKAIFSNVFEDKKLLIYLLRHGYIDEMYNHYLTYFHPGSLTENDMKFIFSIKNYEVLEMDYPLNKIDKIIERLNGNEFKQIEILNYDLFNYLIENREKEFFKNYYETIIIQLSNETIKSLAFIKGVRLNETNKQIFIQSLSKKWNNIWRFIDSKMNFNQEEKDRFLSEILAFSDIEDIKKINQKNELSEYIAKHNNFPIIVPSEKKKIEEILLVLNVKFKSLETLIEDNSLLNYVIQNELYEINRNTLSSIFKVSSSQLSYSFVMKTRNQSVISYLDKNIEIYIEQVLLEGAVKEENMDWLVELLNHEDVSMDLKKALIDKQDIIIDDITKVNIDVWSKLFLTSKVDPVWSNILTYFEEKGEIDNELLNYFNSIILLKKLVHHDINDYKDFYKNIDEFFEALIQNEDIREESFKVLTSSLPQYINFPIKSLSRRRVTTLINYNILAFSHENLETLKSDFNDIVILYLEKNIDELIENFKNYSLESDDLIQLLHSKRISKQYKVRLIEHLEVSKLSLQDSVFANELSDFILKNNIEMSLDLFKWLLSFDLNVSSKIRLITKNIKNLNFSNITEVLIELGNPYSDISNNGKRPQIKNNQINQEFVKSLENKNYISSFSTTKENIKINTKVKKD